MHTLSERLLIHVCGGFLPFHVKGNEKFHWCVIISKDHSHLILNHSRFAMEIGCFPARIQIFCIVSFMKVK